MSSLEIAELTLKEHKHVRRDIEVMLRKLALDESRFGHTYKDASNRTQNFYRLPKRECLILISGYSVELRAKIIDRWQELEKAVPFELRQKSKAVRNAYTQCLRNHGVNKPHEFIQLTYTHKEKLQIPRTKKKDQYDSEEILLTAAAEMLTQWHVEKKSLNGYKEIKPAAVISANAVFASTIGLEEGSIGKAKQLSSEAA
ncbi:Rha family transcriptional regulator [Leptospira jelokensis]|uniref:Phage regulatory protein n=1 Tax=Leptospira jelokensis TaxID=2484931 RepID=A0A4Z0ZNG3_9LEPT|nr:Rha family transcriptional regulator [Leptospira jelokensis]TGL58641.1 hypothetical protein EHQ62_16955 [Leptospira jelokensis]